MWAESGCILAADGPVGEGRGVREDRGALTLTETPAAGVPDGRVGGERIDAGDEALELADAGGLGRGGGGGRGPGGFPRMGLPGRHGSAVLGGDPAKRGIAIVGAVRAYLRCRARLIKVGDLGSGPTCRERAVNLSLMGDGVGAGFGLLV